MTRHDGRDGKALRKIDFEAGFIAHHPGSVLVSFGKTRVLVVATTEERVPHFREASGGGWLTADYAMLPASTHERRRRERDRQDGRSVEIQRLIGRSLRGAVDLRHLGPRTLHVDCDVLQADGGTRTASITGAWVAVRLCLEDLARRGKLGCAINKALPNQVAAVSLGVLGGKMVTDLDYEEDHRCDTDLNLVALADGRIIEVQGTAEGAPLTRTELDGLVDQGLEAIDALCALQRAAVEQALAR